MILSSLYAIKVVVWGIGSPFANTFAPQNSGANVITGSGDGKNYPTKEISAAYSKEDLRKDVSMADSYYDKSKDVEAQVAYVKKFLSEVSIRYDAENDWPVIRYADVLLMYAEVLNEVDGPSAGLKYLNLVRERAGLSKIESDAVTTRNVFRTYLEKERRLELAFENQRWFDLLRWGQGHRGNQQAYSGNRMGFLCRLHPTDQQVKGLSVDTSDSTKRNRQ